MLNLINRLFAAGNCSFGTRSGRGVKNYPILLAAFMISVIALPVTAQTSWTGTTSTVWSSASNWTNGVPTSTVDAIIGDANFTGTYQPGTTQPINCKSLTIGSGTKASTLNIDKMLTVEGNITIGANGTINHSNSTISLKGNWQKTGTYNASNTNSTVIFSGVSQAITGATTFKKLKVNAGSTTTLNAAITIAKALTVEGIFDPNDPGYLVSFSGGTSFSVNSGGELRVKASTFSNNYTANPTLNPGSIVNYSASSTSQTIAVLTYSTLRISGASVKAPANNITLLSSTAAVGNLEVTAGTLDLTSRTLNRGISVAGGSITIANGATLKIGGVNSFPSNYANSNLATTSTVEYNGAGQTVSNKAYGNLRLSSSGGAATKTMPSTAMIIANDFTSAVGAGTSVSFTAGASITVSGNMTIGASTTFGGASYNHTISGNWENSGSFTGSTSTITLNGTNKTIGGSATTTFNNLTISGFGISSSASNLIVTGNLSTSGAGSFTHISGGTLTMSGSSKIISGSGITFHNLTISGTISTASSFLIAGNLSVGGSLNASSGTIEMSGTTKTLSGAGAISLYGFRVTGTVSTTNNITLKSELMGVGKLTATAGTLTLTGTTTYAGAHDLFNVTLNGTKLQLGANSTFGIAGVLTLTAGTFDVSTTIPNTVIYNSTGAQSLAAATYNNLTLAGGGIKTAGGNLAANHLTINSGVTFAASSYSHSVSGNWINHGTFSGGSSTVLLGGTLDTSIGGNSSTTFNALTLNKTNSSNFVSLASHTTVGTINMTSGELRTGSYSITITGTRAGNGIITGTITRTHTFSSGVAYAFESAYNTVTLTSLVGSVTSITVIVNTAGSDASPLPGSTNRIYTISISNTGSYVAALRLHYLDEELNGNTEAGLELWRYSVSWNKSGKWANDTSNNWVENVLLTDISGRWTLSNDNTIAIWKGATSSAWETASNWKSGSVPLSSDVVQIGSEAFANQPSVNSVVTVKAITFESAQSATLTIGSGGSLNVSGTVRGNWTADAAHSISIGSQSVSIGGDLLQGSGNPARVIHVALTSGSLDVNGTLTQTTGSNLTFSGAGTMNVKGNYNYSGGTFSSGSSTVSYTGTSSQVIAAVTYNNLFINKTSGAASIAAPLIVNGNLTLSTGGSLDINADVTIAGNFTANSGVTVNENGSIISVAGNWAKTGAFNPTTGTVVFNGSGNQIVSGTTFNRVTLNKSNGTVSLTGNLVINGNLTLTAGTLDLGTYTANRSIVGGTLTLADGATLILGGTANFPANFNTKTISPTSSVEYNGTGAQSIVQVTYGNLTVRNDSSAKSITGPILVAGNLLIDNATLNSGSHTVTVQGNLINNGTFSPSTGTVILNGVDKLINGSTHFNNLIITGSYTSDTDTDLTIDGNADVSGSFTQGVNNVSIGGDLIISGTYSTDGTSTYTGSRVQTVRLTGSFLSPLGSALTVFDGSVAPVLNSTTPPVFVNVQINNTSTITPSVNWTVLGDFNVAPGCTFDGGSLTHTFYGSVANGGSLVSNGTLHFNPAPPYTTASSVMLSLGSEASFLSTGTVIFGGSRQIVLDGAPDSFHNITISNTNAAGITPSANWTVDGDFIVSSDATFNGGNSLTHTLRKDLEVAGTFNGESSTVILDPMDSINYLSASGSLSFYNLTVADTIVALSNLSIEGNLVNNSYFDVNDVTVSVTGSSPSSIGGTTNPLPIHTLHIEKSSATVSLAVDISELTDLTISGGTLVDGGMAINESNSGGSLQVNAGASLKIEGTNSLPVFSNYLFDPLSTIDYAGSDQTIAPQGYGGLALSNAGSKTLAGGATQVYTITNNSTLIQPNDAVLQVLGNWINNGVFTPNAGTVEFNGTSTQSLSGTTVTNFANISVTNTARPGLRVESNQNITGVLTLGANVVFDADGVANDKVFTLVSSADEPTGDASIAVLPAGAQVSGNITVQRYMTREGANNRRIYRYIASPVQNATVSDLQNEIPVTGSFTGTSVCTGCGATQSMFQYNESVITDSNNNGTADNNDGYIDFPANANTEILQPGLGYALYVRGNMLATTNWDVRGPVNTANENVFSFPITFTLSGTLENDGWNLVGNPFPATIDWSAASGWTKTNVEQSIYIRNNGLDFPNYAAWNGLIGINGGSRYIAMGQAFWVKASGATPALQANENVKAAGSQTSFFRVAEDPITNLLRISLVSGNVKDESAIHFRDGATEGFDASADARKIPGSSFNLSSVLTDGTKLSINSLPAFNCMATVRLAIENVSTTSSYRLDFSDVTTFDPTVHITLIDKFTNTTFDVRSGGGYSFTVTANGASYGVNRFELNFSAAAPSSDFQVTAAPVCEGADAAVQISNSEAGTTYAVIQNGTVVVEPVVGTGLPINLTVPAAKLQLYLNAWTIVATTAACHTEVSKPVEVFVDRLYSVKSLSYNEHCGPGSFELTATGAPANGAYNWYAALQDSEPILNQHQAVFNTPHLTASTSFFVAVVNAAGCEGDRAAIAITVAPSLKDNFGLAYNDFCTGTDATVTISDSQPDALYTFTDSNSTVVGSATGNGSLVTVSLATNGLKDGKNFITLVVSIEGCSQQVMKTIEVNAESIYEITTVESGAHCGPGRVTLTATGAPSQGTYVWYDSPVSTVPLAKQEESEFVTPNLDYSAIYYVAIANVLGCEGARRPVAAEIVEFLNHDFVPAAKPVCEGEDAVIEISQSQSGIRYQAMRNGVVVAGPVTGNGAVVTLTMPATYVSPVLNMVQVQGSAEGCVSTATKSINFVPIKRYEVATVVPAVRCGPGSVSLSATGAPTDGQYFWYSSPTAAEPLGQGDVFTTTVEASTTYYVSVANALGCEGPRKAVTALVNTIPAVDISETGGVLTSNFAAGNQWYLNNEKLAGATSDTWEASGQGVYRLEVTQNQCTGSDEIEFVVMAVDREHEDDVLVYPNTTSDIINVKSWETENQHPVSLLTSTGQLLEIKTTTREGATRICSFQLEHLPAGLYLIRYQGLKRTVDLKVIKN